MEKSADNMDITGTTDIGIKHHAAPSTMWRFLQGAARSAGGTGALAALPTGPLQTANGGTNSLVYNAPELWGHYPF